MDKKQRIRLSKLMSYILRHEPCKFGILPDREGFVKINDLIEAVRKAYPWVEKEHIKEVVSKDEKGRYELRGNKIRALYDIATKLQ